MQNDKTTVINPTDSLAVASEAVKVLLEKKGLCVKMYDVREKSAVTDFYVNATGRSTTQAAALADDVCETLEKLGITAMRVEGRRANNWLLVDYGNVIVNVFDKPTRDFYDFDRHLPADTLVDIEHLVKEVDEKFDLNKK